MEIIIALSLLVIAYFTGNYFEKAHYTSIKKREQIFLHKPAVTLRTLVDERPIAGAHLVMGSVVVSVDHFKRLMASFRSIFGGELHSYASLVDRGRREAILRMKQSSPDADIYINMRLETATISKGQGKSVGCVEVCAYATAVKFVS